MHHSNGLRGLGGDEYSITWVSLLSVRAILTLWNANNDEPQEQGQQECGTVGTHAGKAGKQSTASFVCPKCQGPFLQHLSVFICSPPLPSFISPPRFPRKKKG